MTSRRDTRIDPKPAGAVAEAETLATRLIQPTMSKTDLLLNCPWPFNREAPIDPDVPEYTRYGSAFHELMAICLSARAISPEKRWKRFVTRVAGDYDVEAEGLQYHVEQSFKVLMKWLTGNNPFSIDFTKGEWLVEQSYALRVSHTELTSRPIANPTKELHSYKDLEDGEFAGTIDLVVYLPGVTLVIDHKTGFGPYHNPLEVVQLKSLGLAVKREGDQLFLGVCHADRRALTTVYVDECEAGELQEFRNELADAFAKIGSGYLRVGYWCRWCPGKEICPTRNTSLLAGARDMLPAGNIVLANRANESVIKATDMGKLHQMIAEFKKLSELAREDIKQAVKDGKKIIRPDGKILIIQEKTIRSLSMASIHRALGKAAGAELIAKLEAMGCVDERTQEELHAVD